MANCNFALSPMPGEDIRDDYYYKVRSEDVRGAKTGRKVLERIAMYIRYGDDWQDHAPWMLGGTYLAQANYHNLEFERQSFTNNNGEPRTECWPSLDSLSPGATLRIPNKTDSIDGEYLFPTDRLTQYTDWAGDNIGINQSGFSPVDFSPTSPRVDPSGVVFTGDDEDEDSSSTWLIWGAVALAIGGTWWMMSKNKQ